ncbi:hypothetical protein L6164_035456 [Bauhinia variegata]|uniref:Uncharacterized protein n=1 Tax=Bauhinia variegata TaxID=167791 RepID=A0ACB9KE00_BAUVA|nr:hypothetical protein L6164_035456 [Bauhinia variegata]
MGEATPSDPATFLLFLLLFSEGIPLSVRAKANLDYACGQAIDCSPSHEGGTCYLPNTTRQHASFAMNSYYQSKGRNKWDCDFRNTGLIAVTDPSYGSCCIFEGGETQLQDDPTDGWCVAKPGTNDALLQSNIDFVCNRFNCKDIQQNGQCFNPNTLINHASFAMNLWYRTIGKGDCNFTNSGLIAITDPNLHQRKSGGFLTETLGTGFDLRLLSQGQGSGFEFDFSFDILDLDWS